MQSHRVPLPAEVTEPFEVWRNGVRQERGADFEVLHGALEFHDLLEQQGGPTKTGWFLGFWGVGTYQKNDEIDVRYEQAGQPRVAQGLALAPE